MKSFAREKQHAGLACNRHDAAHTVTFFILKQACAYKNKTAYRRHDMQIRTRFMHVYIASQFRLALFFPQHDAIFL